MIFIQSLLISLPLLLEPPHAPTSDETEFGYYFGELMTYGGEESHPMVNLITTRLSEALFQSESTTVFQERVRLIKRSAEDYPELAPRFAKLDTHLQKSLGKRVQSAKGKRLIYAATGAVIGALVGIPIGKLIAAHSTLGQKVLWIAIPSGALLGAGAGYLLGGILEAQKLADANLLSRDLTSMQEELSH
jgi:hypothetical protein